MCPKNHTHVEYPRSAQAYSDARTSTRLNQKGYSTIALIFRCLQKIVFMLHIPEALRHTVTPGLQPAEPERIFNNCLDFQMRP